MADRSADKWAGPVVAEALPDRPAVQPYHDHEVERKRLS
jgi:hypothetical protein